MAKKLLRMCLICVLFCSMTGWIRADEAGSSETMEESETQAQENEKGIISISVGEKVTADLIWNGPVLAVGIGTVMGPTGKETYYNQPMQGVVRIMRGIGFDEEAYPYWEREDGVKMLGDYVMVAANLDRHPRGSLVPCSRGMAIVCDTGEFAVNNPEQLDVAVNW